jgi:hypothetical protein
MHNKTGLCLVIFCLLLAPRYSFGDILFQENFEDGNVAARGWYDSTHLQMSTAEHTPGSTKSVEYRFPRGSTKPAVSGNAIRRMFAETDSVYMSVYVKHSENWIGSNQSYHPHEFYILTNLEDKWAGPSATHMTAYVEENNGRLVMAIQDSLNIDESNVGEDLIKRTEHRATAGCNGTNDDGHTSLACYSNGDSYRNSKVWTTSKKYLQDARGPYYKGDWHRIEAYFRLNSIVNGKGVADGVMQYWFDGVLVIDHNDVIMRTAEHPNMKFNQFMIAPYIGDGSPVDQTMWVDDLTVATARPVQGAIPAAPGSLQIK